MADKTKPVSIRLAPAEIEQLQGRAYLSASVTGIARDLIRTGLVGGDKKALADRLMLIEWRLVALEHQGRETHARALSIVAYGALDAFELRSMAVARSAVIGLLALFGFALCLRIDRPSFKVTRGSRLHAGSAGLKAFARACASEYRIDGRDDELVPSIALGWPGGSPSAPGCTIRSRAGR
jgi:hypothetical protein